MRSLPSLRCDTCRESPLQLPSGVGPIAFPQTASKYLSRFLSRAIVVENNQSGYLIVGEGVTYGGLYVLLVKAGIRGDVDMRGDCFAILVVWDADYHDITDARDGGDHGFDFDGVDIDSTGKMIMSASRPEMNKSPPR